MPKKLVVCQTAVAAPALSIATTGRLPGKLGLVRVLAAPKLLPAGTFAARRGLPSVVLLRGFAGAAFIQTDVFIPLMLTRERGFSPSPPAAYLTGYGLALVLAVAGIWVAGRTSVPAATATQAPIPVG